MPAGNLLFTKWLHFVKSRFSAGILRFHYTHSLFRYGLVIDILITYSCFGSSYEAKLNKSVNINLFSAYSRPRKLLVFKEFFMGVLSSFQE